MDCNAVAEGAEALDKIPPVCDERDETEYAPKQCGSDGWFIFLYQGAFVDFKSRYYKFYMVNPNNYAFVLIS